MNEKINKTSDGMPIILFEYQKSYLFGLVKISLVVEDRRPDIVEMIGKYKHQIYFKFFNKEISIVTRSTNGIGTYRIDNETVLTNSLH